MVTALVEYWPTTIKPYFQSSSMFKIDRHQDEEPADQLDEASPLSFNHPKIDVMKILLGTTSLFAQDASSKLFEELQLSG